GVPDPDHAVHSTAGHEVPMRAERHAPHPTAVKLLDFLAAHHVPDPDAILTGRGQERGIRLQSERYLMDGHVVAFERADGSPGGRLPDCEVCEVNVRATLA